MTFVLREVRALRALGWTIGVASVNDTDRPQERLSAHEREEAAQTFYVKRHLLLGGLHAHIRLLLCSPRRWLAGWARVFRLSGYDLRRWGLQLAYFTEGLMVAHWMRANGFTHLHAHLGSQASTVGLYVRDASACSFSITIHGPSEFFSVREHALAEKMAEADFVVCISFFARSQMMLLSDRKRWPRLEVCRLGVDPQRFSPALRAARVPGAGGFRILSVGRLAPVKAQALLVDAVARLHAEGVIIRLTLVGEGPDRAVIEAMVRQAQLEQVVVLAGGVNQDAILPYFADADCFCLPSFAEGVPVALMEAMAVGVACVSTYVAGIPDLIQDRRNGLLVPPGDLDSLVNALRELAAAPDWAAQLGEAGRAKVLADYHLENNVAALASIFQRRLSALRPTQITP